MKIVKLFCLKIKCDYINIDKKLNKNDLNLYKWYVCEKYFPINDHNFKINLYNGMSTQCKYNTKREAMKKAFKTPQCIDLNKCLCNVVK